MFLKLEVALIVVIGPPTGPYDILYLIASGSAVQFNLAVVVVMLSVNNPEGANVHGKHSVVNVPTVVDELEVSQVVKILNV